MKSNYKEIEELQGFRKPEKEEVEKIGGFFQAIFEQKMSRCKRISRVLWVCGMIALLSTSLSGIAGGFAGAAFFALAFYATRMEKRYQREMKVFQNGEFQVLEGKATEISANMDYPGMSNVRFQSNIGEILNLWCTVQQSGLQLNTPLLLAYVGTDKIKGSISRAFTPYMLTPEGMKHYL